jgi:hypothetical protein
MKRIIRVLPPRTAKLPRKRGKGKRAGAQLQNQLLPLVTGALGQIKALGVAIIIAVFSYMPAGFTG